MSNCIEDKIIGLSDIDCICYNDDKPVDANESNSGLFITDIIPLGLVSTIQSCEIPDYWNLLTKIRSNAVRDVYDELIIRFNKEHKKKFTGCNTNIGDTAVGSTNTFPEQYQGVKLSNFVMEKGCMILKGINTAFSYTGTIDVTLYSNQSTTPVQKWTLDTTQDRLQVNSFTQSIEIPTWIEGCDDLEYYFVYDKANGQSKANKCHCGCNKRKCWEKQTRARGITGTDLTDIESWTEVPTYCNGLMLQVEFVCKEDAICNDGLNYDTAYGRSVAKAVQIKSALEFLKKLYGAGISSVEDAICKKDLDVKIADLHNKYKDQIKQVYELMDVNNSTCFICKSQSRMVRI